MATHDYVIDNSTGANVRADINNVLQAILTNNSNSSAPSTTAAYMWWADTTNGVLKIRNSANNAWVELLQLDGTLTLEDGSASTPALAFRDDLNTGIFSGSADEFNIATGGTERFVITSAGRCGIGTTDPGKPLDVAGEMRANAFIGRTNISAPSEDTSIYRAADNTLGFGTAQNERMRIDSSGRLLIGFNSSFSADGNQTNLQVCGTNSDSSSGFFARFANNANAPFLMLAKSRNGTVGGNTVLQADDQLGVLAFLGNDGSGFHEGARITAVVESGVGDNDLPTALTFKVNTVTTCVNE